MYLFFKPDFSGDLTISMISSIFSFEIINVVMSDPKSLFCINTSVADTAAVNPNGTKTLLANSVSTFFINGQVTFLNGPRKLSNSEMIEKKKRLLF